MQHAKGLVSFQASDSLAVTWQPGFGTLKGQR